MKSKGTINKRIVNVDRDKETKRIYMSRCKTFSLKDRRN